MKKQRHRQQGPIEKHETKTINHQTVWTSPGAETWDFQDHSKFQVKG